MTIEEYIIKRCKEDKVPEECCSSCIEDKQMGYGDDIEGCCCRHSGYLNEAFEKGLKYQKEKLC